MATFNEGLLLLGILVIAAVAVGFLCWDYFDNADKNGATYVPYLPASVLLVDRYGVETLMMCPLEAWSRAIPGIQCFDGIRDWPLVPSDDYAGVFTRMPRSAEAKLVRPLDAHMSRSTL
jgi:hypothetical protein